MNARLREDSEGAGNTPLLDTIQNPADLRDMKIDALRQLCDELRRETISVVSETGGHLGASLGVIELTVALHAVFHTPEDILVWDVGHQSYPHKILTGRRNRMHGLRKGGGLSGFTRRKESRYDPFGAAHSSTSISASLGFAIARDLGNASHHVVCVIGDGAISAGMAYEAMNNAGVLKSRLVVILNDNDMSIDRPVGAMSAYLARLWSGDAYRAFHDVMKRASSRLPDRVRERFRRIEGYTKGIAVGGTLFEELGFNYIGPIDGHMLEHLLPVLRNVRAVADGPTLIHCVTRKGKGYPPAESADDRFHGVGSFDIATGATTSKMAGNAPSYTRVFADSLIQKAEQDERIVAVTAAMPSGTGLIRFQKHFPERCFDVGIAEQHAVTFSAGLAAAGMRPFAAIYSTFLQRAYDQIVHDVAIQELPVRFAIDRAGLVGADGPTHAGAFDLAFLCCLPGFTIMAAADEAELVHMVATAAVHDGGPCAFRYPRGEGTGVSLPPEGKPLEIGRGRVLREGNHAAILSLGARLGQALAAAEILAAEGIETTVADARFAKPLDRDLICQLAEHHAAFVTIEEGSQGGFGAHVLHLLANEGYLDRGRLVVRTMTLPNVFMEQDTPAMMYFRAGLDGSAIAATVRSAVARNL